MITGIIIAKNEEKYIKRCILSLQFCSEIIVIDDYSSDNTANIVKQMGAKVFKRNLNNNYASQRNYALEHSNNEWVLFVDADEIIPKDLSKEILENISEKYDGYLIKRSDIIFGKTLRYGEFGNVKLLRLAKRSKGIWKKDVHEYWDIKGNIGEFKNRIIHYPHQSLYEFIEHINIYSIIHSKEKLEKGERLSLIKIVSFPFMKFIKGYIIQKGFLDGTAGFVSAMIMSLHSFLAWSNLWLSKRSSQEH